MHLTSEKIAFLIQLKRTHHNFKTSIFKKSTRFFKKESLFCTGIQIRLPFSLLLVGHVRRRFVSPKISFKRKYCRCLGCLPCQGNLVSILASYFNSWAGEMIEKLAVGEYDSLWIQRCWDLLT